MVLVFAAVVAISACLVPSVPIPPPEPQKMSFSVDLASGTARYSFDADPSYANAIVYVFNRDKGVGVITTAEADGSVLPTDPFAATEGDHVVVTYELESQLAATCIEMREGRSGPQFECSLGN